MWTDGRGSGSRRGHRLAAGGVGGACGGGQAKIAMSRHWVAYRGGRTGGRIQPIPSRRKAACVLIVIRVMTLTTLTILMIRYFLQPKKMENSLSTRGKNAKFAKNLRLQL